MTTPPSPRRPLDEQVKYGEGGRGDLPSQNIPVVFSRRTSSVTEICVWCEATDSWYDLTRANTLPDVSVRAIHEMNDYHNRIYAKWRDSYFEQVIEMATEALDRLHQQRSVIGDTVVFLRFQRWLYKYLSRSLWAITDITFQRLSQKISFHFEDHLLESWRCHRMGILIAHEFDIRLICGEDCRWRRIDGKEWTHDARYQRDCLSFANASLALIRYIARKIDTNSDTDNEIKDGFAKAIVNYLKEAFRNRELVKSPEVPRCAWDRYLIHRVYLLACLRGPEDVQNKIANLHCAHQISEDQKFCPDENHNDLTLLEQFLGSVAAEVCDAKFPEILLNVEDVVNPKPKMKEVVNTQQPRLWWLDDSSQSDAAPEPDVPPSPRDRDEKPYSVEDNLHSPGVFGHEHDAWEETIRCYKNRVFGVYGQIPHSEMMSSSCFEATKRRFCRDHDNILVAGSLQRGRSYHARLFQYQEVDDMWHYYNCIFRIWDNLKVTTEGRYRKAYRSNILHYGDRVAKMYKDGGRHAMKYYVGAVRNQGIARYYAQTFNEKLHGEGRYRVHVLRADLIHVFDDCHRQTVIGLFTTEELGPTDEFFKFTGRPACNDENREVYDCCMSFAHHAYKQSERRLVITDFQGFVRVTEIGEKEIVLTDLAIHAPNATLLSPESMNQGQHGIDSFFRVHKHCNQFCNQMKLHDFRPLGEAENVTEEDLDPVLP